jgi:hypothetical protein
MANLRKLLASVYAAVLCATPAWAQTTSQSDDDSLFAFLAILLLVVAFVYAVPTFVAFYRHHPSRWAILLVNVVFGATLLGWLGALIWAMHGFHRPDKGSNGGESGLNVFVNDERIVRISNPEQMASVPDPVEQLTKLKALLDCGALAAEEYDAMRKGILSKLV